MLSSDALTVPYATNTTNHIPLVTPIAIPTTPHTPHRLSLNHRPPVPIHPHRESFSQPHCFSRNPESVAIIGRGVRSSSCIDVASWLVQSTRVVSTSPWFGSRARGTACLGRASPPAAPELVQGGAAAWIPRDKAGVWYVAGLTCAPIAAPAPRPENAESSASRHAVGWVAAQP